MFFSEEGVKKELHFLVSSAKYGRSTLILDFLLHLLGFLYRDSRLLVAFFSLSLPFRLGELAAGTGLRTDSVC